MKKLTAFLLVSACAVTITNSSFGMLIQKSLTHKIMIHKRTMHNKNINYKAIGENVAIFCGSFVAGTFTTHYLLNNPQAVEKVKLQFNQFNKKYLHKADKNEQ